MSNIIKYLKPFSGYVILAIYIVVLFTITDKIPTEDGGLHIATAHFIKEINAGKQLFNNYLEISNQFEPNALSDYVLSFLLTLFKVFTAEKILLILIISLNVIGYFFYIKRIQDFESIYFVLLFPFTLSYPFHLGLYNYLLSLGLFWFCIGVHESLKQRFTFLKAIIYILLSLLAINSHIVSGILILVYFFSDFGVELVLNNIKKVQVPFVSIFKQYGVLLVLNIFLIVLIYISMGSSDGEFKIFSNLKWKGFFFASLSSLYSFHIIEFVLSVFISISFLLSFFYILKKRLLTRIEIQKSDRLLFIGFIFTVMYFAAPDSMSGGTMLSCRLSILPFLFFYPWLHFNIKGTSFCKRLQIFYVLVVTVFCISFIYTYVSYDKEFKNFKVIANYLKKEKTLLFISTSNFMHDSRGKQLSQRAAPYMNAEGYLGAMSGTLGLSNLMAWTYYAKVDYRENYNPNFTLHPKGSAYYGSKKEILNYSKTTFGEVDYIVVLNDKFLEDNSEDRGFLINFDRITDKELTETFKYIKHLYKCIYCSFDKKISIYSLQRNKLKNK